MNSSFLHGIRFPRWIADSFTLMWLSVLPLHAQSVIVNHEQATLADLQSIPEAWVDSARAELVIAYGHTSHGSQIVDGMSGLVGFLGDDYAFNSSGTGGALQLRDTPFSGASDLGNPDRTSWAQATRSYLDAHNEVNVIMWSWCGQVSSASEEDIDTYLSLMSGLEEDYPDVTFVYMTGHLDGSGLEGNTHLRNEQIRQYCEERGKVLFDFNDIETYDPDGVYYGEYHPDDGCNYDSDGDWSRESNWAQDWQNSHEQGVDWYDCGSAHSEPLNANMKAYAVWWLWARLAGWDGGVGSADVTPPTVPTGLECDEFSGVSVELHWNASQDAVGVVLYRVYRNGTDGVYGSSEDTVFSDTGVALGSRYSYRISAVDAAGNESVLSEEYSLLVHDEQCSDYGTWRSASYSSNEQGDPEISGAQADPDGVGLSNLCRYAFGLPARGPVNPPVEVGIWQNEEGKFCSLEFQRKGYAPELSYVVESSNDMVTWSVVNTLYPGYPKDVVVEDEVPVGVGMRRFMRVRVVESDA